MKRSGLQMGVATTGARARILAALLAAPLALSACSDAASESATDAAAGRNPGPGPGPADASKDGGVPSSDAAIDTPRDATVDAKPAPRDASTTDGGGFANPPAPKAGRVTVGVKNGCPVPLWIHAAGNPEVLQPDNAKLATGEVRWYDAPNEWSAARITAYGGGPQAGELEKAEMTFSAQNGLSTLNYNITYVDWLGLPVAIESKGGGSDCKPVGCYAKRSTVLTDCPDGLLSGNQCLSARSYCLNPANQGKDYCKKLDAETARCASTKAGCGGASGSATPDVYACSGPFFATNAKWCAALNRGMLDDPDNTNTALYYKGAYNSYAKWVHATCPGIYAFPYDDYPSNAEQSGFHACAQGRELHVTFCPAG